MRVRGYSCAYTQWAADDAMELQPLQLQHPFEYASSQPVPLKRPQHFHSFSYGEERELLADATNKDTSLRWYKQPVLYVRGECSLSVWPSLTLLLQWL